MTFSDYVSTVDYTQVRLAKKVSFGTDIMNCFD